MSKIICIKGHFSPLTKFERQEILKIMRQNKNASFMIEAKDDRFNPILDLEFKSLVKSGKIDEVIKINDPHQFSFDEFYKYSENAKEYIYKNEDLLKELLKEKVSEHRFNHSLSVANTAKALALKHRVDPELAYLSGILHDVLKSYDENELDQYLEYSDPKRLNEPFPIKHAYACKYYLREHLNLYDYKLLQAIYHHADGQCLSKLGKILYIADKREPLRKIEDSILDIAFRDLDKGFELLKIDVQKYLKEHKNV